MSARSIALAAALFLSTTPLVASADTLHGTVRTGRPGRTTVVRTSHGSHAGQGAHRSHRQRTHRHRAHVHRHGHCRFVEGHYAIRHVRVVLPGHYVERVVPARYEVRWHHHRFVRVEVSSRRVVREWVPKRVETRRKRVWVRGRWVCS